MIKKNPLSRVSIVIPTVVSDLGLVSTLVCRDLMGLFDQVIIVVSGVDTNIKSSLAEYFPSDKNNSNLSFVCINDVLHPGQARNFGVKAVKTDYVAFLDARTVPSHAWFESLSDFVQNNHHGLKPGSVQYTPTSFLSEVFIAATFGFLPLSCLPGSILSVETFYRIGSFISARSGEDSEWILRSRLIGVPMSGCALRPQLEYNFNVNVKTLPGFIRKWFRNYSVSFRLPGYQVHKYLYTILGASIALMLFSMWNWRIAGWNESSPLYLPFITRATLILAAMVYISFRAIYLPVSKGIFKMRRPLLLLFCSFPLAILLDFVKTIAGFRAIIDSMLVQFKSNNI